MNENLEDIKNDEVAKKQRHGCLAVYLWFMIVVNSATALFYIINFEAVALNFPAWTIPVLSIGSVFNTICSIALLRWKKWGFWGFVGSAIIVAGINLSLGLGIGAMVGGLMGAVILFGVLHIGKDNKGWPQLQ